MSTTSQEAPPWEYPFGGSRSKAAAATKYHDNPLFKSSPTDNLPAGEFAMSPEDSKENCNGNSGSGKVFKVASSALTRTSSKRVLGERNLCQQPEKQDLGYTFDEPPKTIRALSFPSADLSSSSSSGESSPGSPPSPASRFPLCLSPAPDSSPAVSGDSGGGDSLEEHDYDPKMNLRTPRPKFLRYRPDWRLEFLTSLELAQGESLADALDSGKSPEDFSDQETVTDADEGNRLDSSINYPSVDETLEGEEEPAVASPEEEINAGERISPVAGKKFLPAVLKMVLLGTFTALVLLTTDSLPHGKLVSGLWRRGLTETPGVYEPQEGWDWSPEYDDLTEGFDNETVYELFSTDSRELDTLLQAIMYGSDEEIQYRYVELLEHEQEAEYYSYDQVLDELTSEQSDNEESSLSIANDIEAAASEELLADTEEEAAEAVNSSISSGELSEEDEFPLVPIIDGVKLHEDMNRLRSLFSSGEFLQIAVMATSFFGFSAAVYMIGRSWSSTRAAAGPVPKLVKPKMSEDLVISPECLRLSPYGSFTAYKRTVMNQGSIDEHVKLTPVRRSSRIQSHHRLEPVRRRILLDN